MMIIWDFEKTITRMEIEEKLSVNREVLPNTILTLLTRLEKRGYLKKERDGKINYYSALFDKEPYLKEASQGILYRMFNGVALKANALQYAFQKIRDCVGVGNSEYKHVRLYDFRHTFATRTITKWIEQNEDVNAKLFLLSTYMGHNHPEDTFWYLSSTPELMALSSSKYEHMFGGVGR